MIRTFLFVGVALSLTGCAENRASFFIQQVNAPTEECTYEPSSDSMFISSGFVDVAFRNSYFIAPLMNNQLSPRGSSEDLVAETNGILVEGANVRIWRGGQPEGEVLYQFYQPAATYVPPSGQGITAFVAVPEVAIDALVLLTFQNDPDLAPSDRPRNLADLLDVSFPIGKRLSFDPLITVGVRMLGTTNGGADVETPEFYFPIRLCYLCLVSCPAEANDEDAPLGEGTCANPEAPSEIPCTAGQDSYVDCRSCISSYVSAFGSGAGAYESARLFCTAGCGL